MLPTTQCFGSENQVVASACRRSASFKNDFPRRWLPWNGRDGNLLAQNPCKVDGTSLYEAFHCQGGTVLLCDYLRLTPSASVPVVHVPNAAITGPPCWFCLSLAAYSVNLVD